ncbi:MAG: SpoIID/LytB domain-containing protein [Elusimicrobiota bacterium]|jgi:SpoIID/LytB domain protein
MTSALLFVALLFPAAREARANEAEDVYRAAYADFLDGRYERASSGYRYLETIGATDAQHDSNLALTYRDDARPDQALAFWVKATLLAPTDAFLWNQRAWAYLALGQMKDARDAFRSSLKVSTAAPTSAEADFGLGLAESLDGDLKNAYAPLQAALARSPYLAPAAALELGRITMRQRRWAQAIPFLTMALSQDPQQADAARDLAEAYEKTGQGQAAWQAYKLALDLDPADKKARERSDKILSFLERRPTDAMPLRRLARPLMREPNESDLPAEKSSAASPPVRVMMFTDSRGRPAHLTHFYVMGSAGFRLLDLKIGTEVDRVRPMIQWEVIFKPDNRVIELRDTSGNLRYVTKQPFRFERDAEWGTILIKNPELGDLQGQDAGDRELRGSVEVIPTPNGFHIVDEVPLEQYLPAVIGRQLPEKSPEEAYRTLAVLMRTRVSALMARAPETPERVHLGDSVQGLAYEGLTAESAAAAKGARSTQGVALLAPGGAPEFHLACGGGTEGGVQDRAEPRRTPRSPVEFERFLHSFPDDGQYDEASALAPAIWSRWLRVFDAELLRERAERAKPLGPLQAVRVLRRSGTGRVQAVEVVGARASARFEGERAVADLLSPGSLRSNIFSLQPIYDGKDLRRVLVWGAGTGHGRGLCLTGAVGQAHLGRRFWEILKFYFPGATLPGFKEPPPPPAPRPVRVLAPAAKGRHPAFSPKSVSTSTGAWHQEPRKKRHKRK